MGAAADHRTLLPSWPTAPSVILVLPSGVSDALDFPSAPFSPQLPVFLSVSLDFFPLILILHFLFAHIVPNVAKRSHLQPGPGSCVTAGMDVVISALLTS